MRLRIKCVSFNLALRNAKMLQSNGDRDRVAAKQLARTLPSGDPSMADESTVEFALSRVKRLMDQATGVFGSRPDAARWFREPAIGLESRRPIDLLWTEDGIRLVETLLKRLEHCVYT